MRARKFFKTYLAAYNAAAVRNGLLEIKTHYTVRELVRGRIPTISSDDLYRDFLEHLVEDMWPDAERGFKTLKGASNAHKKAHGSAEDKARRWGEYQAEVDRLRLAHPKWSRNSIREHAGGKFKVSSKTISRNTFDKGPLKT